MKSRPQDEQPLSNGEPSLPCLSRLRGTLGSVGLAPLPLGLAFALLSPGCGGPSEPASLPPAEASRCAVMAPGEPALELPEPQSTLGLQVEVSERWLQAALAAEVPQNLAKAQNQKIGAAGRVSYDIRRSGFTIETEDDALTVSTQLGGTIDVCKPVGPFCVAYGSCQPSWTASVTLPTDFDVDPSLRARTDVGIARGCVLRPVGYDATSELKRITREQTKGVQRRIRLQLRRLQSQLELGLKRAAQPIQFADGVCLQVEVAELSYRPPQLLDGTIRGAVQGTGRLRLGCQDQAALGADPIGASRSDPDAAAPPTLTRRQELAPTIALATTIPVPLDQLRDQLEAALGKELALAVRRTAQRDHNTLYVADAPGSTCPNWVAVSPELKDGRLRLIASAESSNLATRLSQLELAPPAALTALTAANAHWNQQLATGLRQAEANGLSLAVEHQVSTAVEVDESGLRFLYGITGSARLSDLQGAATSRR